MAQQVNVAQVLAVMGNAITSLTQAINQIIVGPPQQHNVLVSTIGAIVGAGVKKPAKYKGEKDNIQKNAEDVRRFLAAYKAYACLKLALNMVDTQGVITRKDSQWIGSFLSFMEGEAGNLLATAKEQTKGASIDERSAKAGEKPEQVWGFIATKPRLIYKLKTQSVQTEVHNRLCLVSVAEVMSKYAEADL
jgi:hypothetical protein